MSKQVVTVGEAVQVPVEKYRRAELVIEWTPGIVERLDGKVAFVELTGKFVGRGKKRRPVVARAMSDTLVKARGN